MVCTSMSMGQHGVVRRDNLGQKRWHVSFDIIESTKEQEVRA